MSELRHDATLREKRMFDSFPEVPETFDDRVGSYMQDRSNLFVLGLVLMGPLALLIQLVWLVVEVMG